MSRLLSPWCADRHTYRDADSQLVVCVHSSRRVVLNTHCYTHSHASMPAAACVPISTHEVGPASTDNNTVLDITLASLAVVFRCGLFACVRNISYKVQHNTIFSKYYTIVKKLNT